jgi:hypothetical protein
VRIGGPLLLTYLVLQIGFLLARLRDTEMPKRSVHAALIAVVVVVLSIAGSIAPHGHDIGRSLSVAAVQGGGPQGTLAINTNSRDVVNRHLDATEIITGETDATDNQLDLVIWPENVIDVSSFSSSIERTEVAASLAMQRRAMTQQYCVPQTPPLQLSFRGKSFLRDEPTKASSVGQRCWSTQQMARVTRAQYCKLNKLRHLDCARSRQDAGLCKYHQLASLLSSRQVVKCLIARV